jgi:hypothetical protein
MAHDIVLWLLSFEIAWAVSPQYSSPLPNFTSLGADATGRIGRDCYRSRCLEKKTLRALRRGALLNQQTIALNCDRLWGLRHRRCADVFCASIFKDFFRAIHFLAIGRVNCDKIVTALEFTFVTFCFDLGDS